VADIDVARDHIDGYDDADDAAARGARSTADWTVRLLLPRREWSRVVSTLHAVILCIICSEMLLYDVIVNWIQFSLCSQMFKCLHSVAPSSYPVFANMSPAFLDTSTCVRLTTVNWTLLVSDLRHAVDMCLPVLTRLLGKLFLHLLSTVIYLCQLSNVSLKSSSPTSTLYT